MASSLIDTLTKNYMYNNAPECPFCGGRMLPLTYCVDGHGNSTAHVMLFDKHKELKACDQCGIVRIYNYLE